MSKVRTLQKLYTRAVGVAFVFVMVTLINDYYVNGYHIETWHKVVHVVLGMLIIHFGWEHEKFWQPFSLWNGVFFTLLALIGIMFKDLGGMEAFGSLDTVLHGIVGISGIVIGLLKGNPETEKLEQLFKSE